jgi:hypothetical protein
MKTSKKSSKEVHVAPTKYGMGDYYGTGIKAKVGKVVENMVQPVTKNTGTPPKSVV